MEKEIKPIDFDCFSDYYKKQSATDPLLVQKPNPSIKKKVNHVK